MQERLAYEVYLNIKLVRIFSSGAHLGEVETEKSTITLKYATDAERIYNLNYFSRVVHRTFRDTSP